MLFALPLALMTLVSDPMVQTFMARITASYLSQKLDTEIRIDALRITFLFDLHLEGLLVRDRHQDTLLYASTFFADIGNRDFVHKSLTLNSISLDNASIGLYHRMKDTTLNVHQILKNIRSAPEDTNASIIDTWTFTFSSLDLYNSRFRYLNETKERKALGMDYTHLDIEIDVLEISDVLIEKDTFNLTIHHLIARDRCGFEVNYLSGQFRVSPKFLIAEELLVETPVSDLSLDFSFHYPDWNAYIEFPTEVEIQSTIRPSVLNMKDIGYYASSLLVMDNEFRIGGDISGKVDNLKGKNMRFAYQKMWFDGDITLFGLPDIEETFINLNIDGMEFSMADIEKFALPGNIRHIDVSPILEQFGLVSVTGNFTGFYNDFVSNASFQTAIGQFTTDVNLRPEESDNIKYEGDLTAYHFDIGKLLGAGEYLGKMNLEAHIDGSGVSGNDIIVGMNGSVDSLDFMNNNFNKIMIAGVLGGRRFNGFVNIFDELLKLDFKGNIDYNRSVPIIDFTADIRDARLYDLNLLKRHPDTRLSTKLWCSFIGNKPDDVEGRLNIDSTYYFEDDKEIFVERLTLLTLKDDPNHRNLSLSSDIVDASLNGEYRFTELYPTLLKMLDQFISLENIGVYSPDTILQAQDYTFDMMFYNTDSIMNVFLPDLNIAPQTFFKGALNTESGDISFLGKSNQIIYKGLRFIDWSSSLSANRESILFENTVKRFVFKEADELDDVELGLDNLSLITENENDSLDFNIIWKDLKVKEKNSGDIAGFVVFDDSSLRIASIRHAEVLVNDSSWKVGKDNYIVLDSTSLTLHNLDFIGSDQKLMIDGVISKDPDDTLSAVFKRWQFSNFDIVVDNDKMDIDGVINGNLYFSALAGNIHFESDLVIKDLVLNEVQFGDARVNAIWNPDDKAIQVDADIIYTGNVGTSKTMDVQGTYYPDQKDGNFDISAYIENFKIRAFNPYVVDVFSGIDGVATGHLKLNGTIAKPELTGKLKLMRTELGIEYLNTKYSFADELNFTATSIDFDTIMIYDTLGNTGIIQGKIGHDYLSDFYLDLDINADNLICLNTDKYQNEIFYGDAFGSGLIEIKGPFDDIAINVKARTDKGTDVFIPLGSSMGIAQHDYIEFLDARPDTTVLPGPIKLKNESGLHLGFDLDVTNNAEIQIFLPNQMGDINSRGSGRIVMSVNPKGDFSIKGDYVISNGNFLFKIQNFIRKRFDIMEGGKISFDGDPYNAGLKIRGLYKLKTTLTGLSTTLDALYAGERVNVDCIIGLSGKLASP
ncbi:MAG: translocation/assembly module TamB domain-containing protein, partial [Bacteroidota bacterium]|nr:translocation/assembly module TamB domain-containing protein [Bacteroidota bacterium]